MALAFAVSKSVEIALYLSRNMQPNPRAISAFQHERIIRDTVCLICLFLFFSRFIDIDIDKAMQRVLKRHISTGIYHVLFHNNYY